ncbi:WD40 repeat-like protein [Ceraceosorus guamensis]|uniref:WD40 repeat-like protein n=1 Tax=Ceraceosorus guamensis TaxID=1522189 RepID=A0A316VTI4_9BASI|nr:WD40 repeat-like protein [Ceraceosorus guamensis]PWN40919.1 WD40 repeat-like protein [Ceraceosorus guamensis]
MVRTVTFEIRWHETQPIYSCNFQPISTSHLRRVLDHNAAQAAGLAPGKTLEHASGSNTSTASVSTRPTAASTASASAPLTSRTQLPIMAGGQSWRFATAGGDNTARLWQVHPNIPSPAALAAAAAASGGASLPAPHPPRVEYLAALKRHSGVVNCVRFSPNGEQLATSGDDGTVIFWAQSDHSATTFGSTSIGALDDDPDAEFAKEHWSIRRIARPSASEIYDLAWAPDGEAIVVGGTDFVARIVNPHDGSIVREIAEHSHYVQGVAWDPWNELIATQSSDRSVHVHALLRLHHAEAATGTISGTNTISRNSRMDIHRRQGSGSAQGSTLISNSSYSSNSGSSHVSHGFVWDPTAKPPMRRASSHASHASASDDDRREGSAVLHQSRVTSVSTPNSAGPSKAFDRTRNGRSATPHDLAALPNAISSAGIRSATPTPVAVPPSPAISTSGASTSHAMNPPQTTPSRRSSFSGSQAETMSPMTSTTSLAPASVMGASANSNKATRRSMSRTRAAAAASATRSPSPVPPLPAIRAPPSPKQRLAQASAQGSLARVGMRMYGDENFSGFFRRLAFSPDGALLVTPSGIFDAPPMTPSSPTMAIASTSISARRGSEAAQDARASPAPRASPVPTGFPPSLAPVPAPLAPRSTVYMYGRANLLKSNAPLAHLPGHKTASLVVSFSPMLYELRSNGGRSSIHTSAGPNGGDHDGGMLPHPTVPLEVGKQKTVALQSAASAAGGSASSTDVHNLADVEDKNQKAVADGANQGISMIGLPYRMIFAVATHDSVWIYDTQQGGPLCCFSNMHYASFTDLAWSPDGQTLMMCSTDGYCSVVVFDYGELGAPIAHTQQPCLQKAASQNAHAAGAGPAAMAPSSSSSGVSSAHKRSASGSISASTPHHVTSALGLGLGDAIDSSHTASPLSSTTKGASDVAGDASDGQSKKKRRVALTLEGPLGGR